MKYLIKNIAGEIIFDGDEMSGASLRLADLSGASLSGADLSGANLSGANLRGANLIGADLRLADLSGADLSGADLSVANLRGANLIGADLRLADLRWANLSGANLRDTNTILIVESDATSNYDIFMTPSHVKIGCQWHTINDWFDFDDKTILKMDGKKAKKFWDLWKPILMHLAKSNGWYGNAA